MDNKLWAERFALKIKKVHRASDKRALKLAKRVLAKISASWRGTQKRSKKNKVECKITIDQLRELLYKEYGKPCRYCKRTIKVYNSVFDHREAISKGGVSNIENFQVLCKTCNGLKGSLTEAQLDILLAWLKSIEPSMAKTIRIRLSGGIA